MIYNMGYRVISAKNFQTKLKATVHKSGKLGFTNSAAQELGFFDKADPHVKFAIDEDNPSVLFLINMKEGDADSFRVNKAGKYYYVNTRLMFDSLQIDYVTETVMFDMIKVNDEEDGVYRMNKRTVKRLDREDIEMM